MTAPKTDITAQFALREASNALQVRGDGTDDRDAFRQPDYRALAADTAATLDALASLLRSVGVGVASNATTHGLVAVAEHVDIAAQMAHQSSSDPQRPRRLDGEQPPQPRGSAD